MKYKVCGYNRSCDLIREIEHKVPFDDNVKNSETPWLADFYIRYIKPLYYKTKDCTDRTILLKEPIQGIIKIVASNKEGCL